MEIIEAQQQHLDSVRILFREYQQWLDEDCCFQGFEAELANLPGDYAAPKGVIYLVFDNEEAIACAAIRPRADKPDEAELKRLYVKESFRGHGLGRKLLDITIDAAKQRRYKSVVLETMPVMQAAMGLYRDYGFKPMPAYGENVNSDETIEYYRYEIVNE